MKDLYKLGARKIAVFSAPPVGCFPLERTLFGGVLRMCVENLNVAARLYNNMLKQQLPILESNLPQSRVAFVDFYNPLIDIINNPQKYGIYQLRTSFSLTFHKKRICSKAIVVRFSNLLLYMH